MCQHDVARSDSHTEPFYHMMSMITVISCVSCGEKLDETREIIGSRR